MEAVKLWRILEEPTGDTYQALLDLAAECCQMFSFDRRVACGLGEDTDRLERQLRPFRVEHDDPPHVVELQKEVFTKDDVRIAQLYWLTDLSLRLLRDAAGLYAWRNPDRPESLCLLRNGGETWLHSHSPSHYGWIEDPALSLQELVWGVPGLQVEPW